MQQLVARGFFGLAFDWLAVPLLTLVNFGIVAAWFYFKKTGIKIPLFAVAIASFCFALWLRALMLFFGTFRVVAPVIVTFTEKLLTTVFVFLASPQFLPAIAAACILLLLMPNAKKIYGRFIYRDFLIPPRTFE
jgi:hypothetical protein